jgi:hypothetical protein
MNPKQTPRTETEPGAMSMELTRRLHALQRRIRRNALGKLSRGYHFRRARPRTAVRPAQKKRRRLASATEQRQDSNRGQISLEIGGLRAKAAQNQAQHPPELP